MSWTDELGTTVRGLETAAARSTVRIRGRWRGGSGVVVSADRIVTNAHNVGGGGVGLALGDGRRVDGQVVGLDREGDLAVISAPLGDLPALAWAQAPAKVGDSVFALAAGRDATRITWGLVSATERSFRGPGGRPIGGTIEHTAPLAPGSSGGPIVNAAGELLGINTNRVGEGFYLALPADAALRARVDALARGESPERKRLGVAVLPTHAARRLRRSVGLPDRDGLLVREVEPEGPAARGGVQQGDLIVALDDRPIADPDDLHAALASGGSSVRVGVLRGAEELTLQVSFQTPGDA